MKKKKSWLTVNRTRVCILMFASQNCQKSEVFGGRSDPKRDNLTESVRGNRFLNFERVPEF